MLKLTFCLRRKPGMTRAEFQDYWFNQHAPLVVNYAEATGTRQYIQMHTRDNELTEVARRGRGGDAPPEVYDGVAQIYWDSINDLRKSVEHPHNLEAGRALLHDERNFIDLANSPLWYGEEKTGIGDPDPSWRSRLTLGENRKVPLLKLIFPLHRKPDMRREEFQRYWLNNHMPLVRKHGGLSRIYRYVQMHTNEAVEYTEPLRRSRAGKENIPPEIYDGIAEVWWTAIDDIKASISDPGIADASQALYVDESKFVDFTRSPLWYGEERLIFS